MKEYNALGLRLEETCRKVNQYIVFKYSSL